MRTLPDKITELTLPSGKKVKVDGNGYLTDQHDWTPEFTEYRAEQEGITLTPLHHEIIKFIRDWEEEHGIMPDVRFVFKYIAKRNGVNKTGAKAVLYELFPYGYTGQAIKMAGMKQPRAWSTG